MLLSSNIIKYENSNESGKKSIITKEVNDTYNYLNNNEKYNQYEDLYNTNILAEKIIEDARLKNKEILQTATSAAKDIEESAYADGFQKGETEGYNAGIEKGYQEGVNSSESIVEEILLKANQNADDILASARIAFDDYMKLKKEEIKELIIEISEKTFKTKLEDFEVVDFYIKEILEKTRNSKMIIFKTNSTFYNEILENINQWKIIVPHYTEMFVVLDNSIEGSKVVIEKENGKVVIDMNMLYDEVINLIREA